MRLKHLLGDVKTESEGIDLVSVVEAARLLRGPRWQSLIHGPAAKRLKCDVWLEVVRRDTYTNTTLDSRLDGESDGATVKDTGSALIEVATSD